VRQEQQLPAAHCPAQAQPSLPEQRSAAAAAAAAAAGQQASKLAASIGMPAGVSSPGTCCSSHQEPLLLAPCLQRNPPRHSGYDYMAQGIAYMHPHKDVVWPHSFLAADKHTSPSPPSTSKHPPSPLGSSWFAAYRCVTYATRHHPHLHTLRCVCTCRATRRTATSRPAPTTSWR
jgi:hypothetical protein